MRKETSTNFENEQRILESCAIAYTIALIGGRWKPTILWHLISGPKRYKDLKEIIPGISERMLAHSLKELEQDGLLQKKKSPGFPSRVDWELTPLGRSMENLLQSISKWGKQQQEIQNRI